MIARYYEDFLLEIGTEELPPREINKLSKALAELLVNELGKLSLEYSEVKSFDSPRRLAILVSKLSSRQPDQMTAFKGPPVEIAFDNLFQPTAAAVKFAEKCQVDLSMIGRIEDQRRVFLYYSTITPGKETSELLPSLIVKIITQLPCSKSMYWGVHSGPFIRPIRWLVSMYGNKPLIFELFGVRSSKNSLGHRFASNGEITIEHPTIYECSLESKGKVIVDRSKRESIILKKIAQLPRGMTIIEDGELLSELVNLVEWPHISIGSFDRRFLNLPREVLILTLKYHQRCFLLVTPTNEITSNFLIVSNTIASSSIIAGFERVVKARLSDAEYFYNTDLRNNLENNLNKLSTITFQAGLGSIYDKTLRLVHLGECLASQLEEIDKNNIKRAALLAKCDLASSMVGEFPELQGIMGYYYALHWQELSEVALAIKEHYLPKFANDSLASSKLGMILTIVDRLDTLVGFFYLNKIPTGEKDPLGVRRLTLGLLRTIIENGLSIDLRVLIGQSCQLYCANATDQQRVIEELLIFIYDRLQNLYYGKNKNIALFRAIVAKNPTDLLDITLRFNALDNFIQTPISRGLIESYKRIKNILEKAGGFPRIFPEIAFILEPEEQALIALLNSTKSKILTTYRQRQYALMLEFLVLFRDPLDRFFATIMVMVDDKQVRNCRLTILQEIYSLLSLLADLSFLISGSGG